MISKKIILKVVMNKIKINAMTLREFSRVPPHTATIAPGATATNEIRNVEIALWKTRTTDAIESNPEATIDFETNYKTDNVVYYTLGTKYAVDNTPEITATIDINPKATATVDTSPENATALNINTRTAAIGVIGTVDIAKTHQRTTTTIGIAYVTSSAS